MRKFLLIAVVLVVMGLMATVAMAEDLRSVTGVELDAPYLIRFTKNITLGVEGGKDIYTNAFQDSAAWIEDDKGFYGALKITYTGSLINFAK